jgi:hypothetical protein
MSQKKSELGARPKIDRAIQDRIGRELRAMYEELLRQPLPENLLAPLRASDELHGARTRLETAVQALRQTAPKLDAGSPPMEPAPRPSESLPQAKLA